MRPDEWRVHSLGELMSFRNGLNFTQSDSGEEIKLVGVADFKSHSALQDTAQLQRVRVAGQVAEADLMASGDLLLVRSNGNKALIGRCLYFPQVNERLSFSGFTIRGRVDRDRLDPEFAAYLMRSPSVSAQMHEGGSGTNISNLSQEILNRIRVAVPALPEQRGITAVLRAWDTAISIAKKLHQISRLHKQALSRRLLSGTTRLDAGQWSKCAIGEFLVESRIPGSTGDVARKLTVRLYGKGVVAKGERRQGSASTMYYTRRAGQFVYSKLDFLNGAFGVVPQCLDGYESTLDLPAFDFLDGIDPRWLLYYVSREDFYRGHLGLANGGRKARRVNPLDLLQISIDLPPLASQKAIADAIDLASEDERNWETNCTLLIAEKRALMTDLFAGNRRVHLPEPTTPASEPA